MAITSRLALAASQTRSFKPRTTTLAFPRGARRYCASSETMTGPKGLPETKRPAPAADTTTCPQCGESRELAKVKGCVKCLRCGYKFDCNGW